MTRFAQREKQRKPFPVQAQAGTCSVRPSVTQEIMVILTFFLSDKWNLMKLKILFTAIEEVNRAKRQATKQEKIFSRYAEDWELYFTKS